MGKPVIIIADTDEKYLMPLELKFAEELGDKVELEIITDPAYFKEYFSVPQKAEILVVGEALYSREIQKHNLANIFVLTEQASAGETGELNISTIFKYTSLKEIYNEIMFMSGDLLGDKGLSRKTQVVMVYSAIGGAGKTTVALGTSACLSQAYKRVLYIDAEYMHSFQYYLTDKTCAPDEIYRGLSDQNSQIYNHIRDIIRNEKFDYLPPFCASLSSLSINYSFYVHLIKTIKESKDYDFIVVDVDSVFNDEKAALLGIADKVLVLVLQDHYSTLKTDVLLTNINCSDTEKYLFVCNKFQKGGANALSEDKKSKVAISEFVEYIGNCGALTVENMLAVEGFQKIAYALI